MTIHAKMEVYFVVMKFTQVSGKIGSYIDKKQKFKFRQNAFTNVVYALLTINMGCLINIFTVSDALLT